MNVACKLGEDLAERGEVLLTSAAYESLPPGSVNAARRSVSISGLTLDYFQVQP